MNGRTILITLIGILCRNNVLLGSNEKAMPNDLSKKIATTTPFIPVTTSPLIPPGQCSVSLTVKPSAGILGSLMTFDANLNCSVIPPFEYQCCYYFWQDNISENVTVTDGLMDSHLSRIYKSNFVNTGNYIMEVTVCWQKIFLIMPWGDLQQSVCDYAVAMNTTLFELTDTLNGYLKFRQGRAYPGISSVLMIGIEASAIFIPTDQRLEILSYNWNINGSEYYTNDSSSILFTPNDVGILSVELLVLDNVSQKNGTFRNFIHCKKPILNAFIKGDDHLLVGTNGTFFITHDGSGPFTFCWVTTPPDSPVVTNCIYDLTIDRNGIVDRSVFYVKAGSESGLQKIIGNLTNDVSKMIITYEFEVFPEVNIRSGILIVILIVGVFMSSMLTYMTFRKQPGKRQQLPVEVADFDFCPGIASDRRNSHIQVRARQLWRSRIFPFLNGVNELFKPTTRKREIYTPLLGSCSEEGSRPAITSQDKSEMQRDDESINSSSSEDLPGSLQMRRMNSDPGTY